MKRFDGYKPDSRYKGSDGFGGRKEVWFDTVDFKIVKEPGARVAGLESGQLQIIEDLPAESAKRLAGNKVIAIHDLKDFWLQGAWVNHSRPPTDNLQVRRAIQVALDMEEIMEIATDGAYTLQPGLQYPGNPYYVKNGEALYNAKDPKKAAALLKQAGYKGEELVIITNSSYQSMYKAAQIVSEQLKAIGMKVRVDVFDWATAINHRRNKDAWNLWFTGQGSGPSVGPFSALKDVVSPQNNQFVADRHAGQAVRRAGVRRKLRNPQGDLRQIPGTRLRPGPVPQVRRPDPQAGGARQRQGLRALSDSAPLERVDRGLSTRLHAAA